jgi:exodeoxyribonuclease VII small subunit
MIEKKPSKESKKEVGFAERIESVEAIVAKIEEGDLSMEEMISSYEKASKLIVSCNKQLKVAQEKIDVIKNKSQ